MKKLLNLKYMVVEIFSQKTAKNVGVNIVSQSKDNHESWRNYFGCNMELNYCDLFVKGDTCTDASCFLVLRSTTRGNMELGMFEQIEVSRHKKDIEN